MHTQQNRDEYFRKLLFDSPFAWWEWNITEDRVTFNDCKVTMLGYDPSEFRGKGYGAFTRLIHPDDFQRTMDAMKNVLRNSTDLYQVDYRILSASSQYHWYMDRGTVIERNASGNPAILRGIVIDLGKESESGASIDKIIQLIESSSSNNKSFILTVCSNCGKVKKSETEWISLTQQLIENVSNGISHGICPSCLYELYPEMAKSVLSRLEQVKQQGN